MMQKGFYDYAASLKQIGMMLDNEQGFIVKASPHSKYCITITKAFRDRNGNLKLCSITIHLLSNNLAVAIT